MARSVAAWRRLVEEGWFETRGEAERWIMTGKVRAEDCPITSAGQMIKRNAAISVRGYNRKYVSKGGLKLEGALQAFSFSPAGRVCIDAGASTGGFTDCLLKHGASLVYAVDVGYGQLAGSLRLDPRVVNLERTNIGDDALAALDPAPTLATVDLSYLSLPKAVPQFARVMHGHGDLLCLVKPLFEVDDPEIRRTGRMHGDALAPLLFGLIDHFIAEGHTVRGVTHSPVTGNYGTLEFFLWLGLDGQGQMAQDVMREAVLCSAEAARALQTYQKA